MSNLKSSQIIDKLKKFKFFIGVFPCDRLPSIPPTLETYGFVANTDPHDQPGTHWVAVYVSHGEAEYFDPFGLPPLNVEMYEFLENNAINTKYSITPIQNVTSTKCGAFCVLFLYLKFHDVPTSKIFHLFSSETKDNDLILEYIRL
jgi:Adenovirus endoprotease